MGSAQPAQSTGLEGASFLLVTTDIGARERLARALRAGGAEVAERRHGPTPAVDVVLVDTATEAHTRKELDMVCGDVRMRWSSVVRFAFAEAAPSGGSVDLSGLSQHVQPAIAADRALRERVLHEDELGLPLAPLGPIRILRVVTASGRTMRVSFEGEGTRGDVDVADGLLVCAFSVSPTRRLEGGVALAPLLDLNAARVTITRRDHPAAVNIMEPVDQALELAAVERQSLMQPLPANDTEPSDVPSLHPIDELPTDPPQALPQAPPQAPPPVPPLAGGPRFAVGDSTKKFAKTMIGAAHSPPAPSDAASTRRASVPSTSRDSRAPTGRGLPPQGSGAEPPTSTHATPPTKGRTLFGVGVPPRSAPRHTSSSQGLPPVNPRLSTAPQAPPAPAQPPAQPPTQAHPAGPVRPPGQAQPSPAGDASEASDAAHARTQMALQPPPPPPERPELESQPILADGTNLRAESDGLPPKEAAADPLPPEPTREELSVASALSLAIADIGEDSQPKKRAREKARAAASEMQAESAQAPAAHAPATGLEPAQAADGAELDDALPQLAGLKPASRRGTRAALAVAVLAVLAGAVVFWQARDSQPPAASAASPAAPAPAPAAPAPEPVAATPTGPGAAAEPPAAEAAGSEPTAAGSEPVAAPLAERDEVPEAEAFEAAPEVEGEAEEAREPAPEPESARAAGPAADEPERDQRGSDKMCATALRLEKTGALDEALHLYQQGLELDPRNPRAFEGIARILLERGDLDGAIEAAERAVGLRSRRARYRVLLGDAYAKAGRRADARRAWERALELDPEYRDAASRLR